MDVTLRRTGLILAALVGAFVPAAAAAAAPLDPRGLEAADEAIVRFEPGTTRAERAEARDAAAVELEQTLELSQAQLVSVDGSLRAALRRLEGRDDVAYAQPNYRYEAVAAAPNDSFFPQLWGMGADPGVGALSAWDLSRGAGQIIAVVDSGVDLSHPDIAPRLWRNPGETPGGGDNDLNGRGDDVHGYDFVDSDSTPDDFEFHGTHVAGIAAAAANNGRGVAGVAPGAAVMPVRALDGNNDGSSSSIGNGIVYAAQEGADVINLSLAGPANTTGDQFLSQALAVARTHDAVVVAAAGNEGNNNDASPRTPCVLPGDHLICVAALSPGGALAGFSNFGATSVDIAAPGVSILSSKTDYTGPLLEEGFEDGLAGWNDFVQGDAISWGVSTLHTMGLRSAADSADGWYASNGYSEIHLGNDLDLTGRRGCRMHFDLRHELASGDGFDVGAFASDDSTGIVKGVSFAGSSSGLFKDASASISVVDGRDDARPFFGVKSDASGIADGVHLDELRVVCRAESYVNTTTDAASYVDAGAGNYVRFDGTSMAAPHVAGIAALVRAADPSASAVEVVQAIKAGATRRSTLTGRVATGGSANAGGAIAKALGLTGAPPTTPTTTTPTTKPRRLINLSRAPKRIRVKRSGRFTYSFNVAPRLRTKVVIRTKGKVRVAGGKRRRLTLTSQRFRSKASGRVTLRVKLSRRELRVLRRQRGLRLRVQVSVTDELGRVARANRNLRLLPPR